jgi:hypothetical protein
MPKTMKTAKLAGSVYFITLGIVEIIVMYMNNKAGWKDFVLLVFLCSPLIVNKKIYYFIFGGLLTILFAYFLYYTFHTNTLYVRGQYEYAGRHFSPPMAFTAAYLFTIISGSFSFLLLRVGLYSSKDKAVT